MNPSSQNPDTAAEVSAAPAKVKARSFTAKLLRATLQAVWVFALLIGISYLFYSLKLDVFRAERWVQGMKPVFITLHLTVAFLIWLRWHHIVDWGIAKGIVKDFEIDRVRACRVKAPMCLVLYTALVVAGPSYLFAGLKALFA